MKLKVGQKQTLKTIRDFVKPYKITNGKGFKLKDFDPADTGDIPSEDKPLAKELLARGVEWLTAMQDKLYAESNWSLLLVFQAMDAAGKDGTIKHVMSGVNPQGCEVYSFKQPSQEELSHNFLWRYSSKAPPRGKIGIFNRSYYEEVLVVRVHENLLQNSRLPKELITKRIWDERLEDIANFEKHLVRNGTPVLKFYLNVSLKEQKKRFIERLEDPDKNWKFSNSDLAEREYWDDYRKAFEEVIRATSTPEAPWFVVPADNKWFTRLVVSAAIAEQLSTMDIDYPKVDAAKKEEIRKAHELLTGKD